MMKKFEQDECLLMAICQEDTCEQTKEEMKKILPFLKHDTEMTALVKGTLEKMEHLTEEIKVYPNDPCPCGSGKKYKQCCGRKAANV